MSSQNTPKRAIMQGMNTALKIEPTPGAEPLYISIKEGAALVRLSHWTLRAWLTQKRLTRYKIGGRTLIRRDELLGLVHEGAR